jgi:hypothetical protein
VPLRDVAEGVVTRSIDVTTLEPAR